MDWLLTNLFPNVFQNISILATLGSTILTILIWYKTGKLYKIYNTKTSTLYIIDKISSAYTKYSNEIRSIKKEEVSSVDPNKKQVFWDIIKEVKGTIAACEEIKSKVNTHIQKFKTETSPISNIKKDDLTYENIWDYYNHLTDLHEALKNMKDIDARKMAS